MWEALDPHKKLCPCVLQNPDKIDNFWFSPHLKVATYSKLPLDERPLHLAATTLQSWLGNIIKQFLAFWMTRKIYIGIRYNFNEKKRYFFNENLIVKLKNLVFGIFF